MVDNDGTTTTPDEAPDASVTGTPQTPDEVTLLKSRNAGLDAKVTELTTKAKNFEQQAATMAAKLADYEAGKVGADEALRAQLAVKEAEAQAARQEAKLARIEGKYPETFGLFGDAAAAMTEDVLAASEARLQGVPADADAPTPRRNNGPQNSSPEPDAKPETSDDIMARLRKMTPSW